MNGLPQQQVKISRVKSQIGSAAASTHQSSTQPFSSQQQIFHHPSGQQKFVNSGKSNANFNHQQTSHTDALPSANNSMHFDFNNLQQQQQFQFANRLQQHTNRNPQETHHQMGVQRRVGNSQDGRSLNISTRSARDQAHQNLLPQQMLASNMHPLQQHQAPSLSTLQHAHTSINFNQHSLAQPQGGFSFASSASSSFNHSILPP